MYAEASGLPPQARRPWGGLDATGKVLLVRIAYVGTAMCCEPTSEAPILRLP